jgi:D-xylose reductase
MTNTSKSIPQVGFGLWKIATEVCADAVYQAIKVGYRHLDSACDYGNEKEVGKGIKRAIEDGLCTREELWITSKLWNTYHRKEHVKPALERSLSDLQLDYLDLYMIHFPIAQPFVDFEERYPPEWVLNNEQGGMQLEPVSLMETWQAMEALFDEKLVHQIGVCNYNSGLLHDLMAYARVKPYGLSVTAFSPLGALSYLELDMASKTESVLEQAVVTKTAQRLGKTAAQVVLRWGIQRGNAIIPKTSKTVRLIENINIFDFVLSDDEMQAIDALNCDRRFNDPGQFCEAAFGRFHPIYD